MRNALAPVLPFPSGVRKWRAEGLALGERERSARSLMWDIGDWWNRGEAYGERAQIVTATDWTGPTHGTCRVAGTVAARWNVLMRINTLSFYHHQIAAAVEDDVEASALLQWCLETAQPRTTDELKTRLKQLRRDSKEVDLAERIEQEAAYVGHQVYPVLYADPPWRFEPRSRITGMDRAPENHYPTESIERLLDLEVMRVAPSDDCVLFAWATAPMLPAGLAWMAHYGFVYKSHCIWRKDRAGTGYWFRNLHELLLVGVRGDIPAPAPGTQMPSVIDAQVGRHSAKPEAFANMIETLYPTVPKLELFARAPRAGWDTWGAEADEPVSDR